MLYERRSKDGGLEGFQPYTFPCRTGGGDINRGIYGQRVALGGQLSLAQLRRLSVVAENQKDGSYDEA